LGAVISVLSPTNITSYTWTVTRPNGTIHTANSAQYVAILSVPGTYDIQITINGNQTQNFPDFITVYAKPQASFTVDNTIGCWPLCVNFTNTTTLGDSQIVQQSWDFGNGSLNNTPSPSYCYPNQGTFSPVLSVTDANGCISNYTAPGLIHVSNNFPNAQFTMSESVTCDPPVSLTVTNTSPGFTNLISEWSFGSDTIPNNNSSFTQTVNGTGIIPICLTVADSIGCFKQLCRNLNIMSDPLVNFTTSTAQACAGSVVTFINQTNPLPTSFAWDFNSDEVTDATGPNPFYIYNNTGEYYPQLTAQFGSQCSRTRVDTIQVIQGVSPQFHADITTSCQLPFTANIYNDTPNNPGQSYQWFINGALVGNSYNLQYTFTSFGNYTIRLQVSTPSGCTQLLNRPSYILIQPLSISFSMPERICAGDTMLISNIQVQTNDTLEQVLWDIDGDGATDLTGLNPIITYQTPGTYSVTVTAITQQGCISTFTPDHPINVQSPLNTDFSASDTTTCAGLPIDFCIIPLPGNVYSWNFDDGSGWQLMNEGASCIQHDYADTGYFDVSLTVFNNACSTVLTRTNYIYVSPPVSKFTFSVSCENYLSVGFQDLSIEADTLIWDFGDGSPLVYQEAQPVHQYLSPGTYTVKLTAVNADVGCDDISQQAVVIAPADASASFSSTSGCPPLHVGFVGSANNVAWDIHISNGDQYTMWYDAASTDWYTAYNTSERTDTVRLDVSQNFWPDIVINEPGCFDISISAVNSFGCSSQSFYPQAVCVTANPNFASFTIQPINTCDSVVIRFQPDAIDLVDLQWEFSDGAVSTDALPIHHFLPPFNLNDTLSATLVATNASGCHSIVTQPLSIPLPIIPSFNVPIDTACSTFAFQFNNTTGSANATYLWDFGDQSTSNIVSPSHIYTEAGYYTVCLSAGNGQGCIRTACRPNAVFIADPVAAFDFQSTVSNCLYTVDFTSTAAGSTAHWNFGDNQQGTGVNAFHTYGLGVYDVTLEVTNSFGCTDSVIVPDILNYGDVIGPFSQVLDSSNCAPFSVGLTAFNPSDTYFSYFWDFNDGNGDPQGNTHTNHNYLEPGTYCPSLIMTDPNGCSVLVACQQPIVIQEFVIGYQVPNEVCAGQSIALNATNGTSYQLQSGLSFQSGNTVGAFTLTPEHSGAYYLTGFFDDCVRTDTIAIVVHELPNTSLQIPEYVCHNDSAFALSGGSPAGGVYSLNGSVISQFNPTWTEDLYYGIVYSYTDSNQCSNSDTATIFIRPLPDVAFNLQDYSCVHSPPIFLEGGQPTNGEYLYQNAPVTTFDPATGTGIYSFTYRWTDTAGCTNYATDQLDVRPNPDIDLTIGLACEDELLYVQNHSTALGDTIVQISWLMNGNVVGTSPLSPPISGAAGEVVSFGVAMGTNYGCVSSFDTLITIHEAPRAEFSLMNGCVGDSLMFQDLSFVSASPVDTFLWSAEGLPFAQGSASFTHAFSNWGERSVSLCVVNTAGCADTATKSVYIYPLPEISIYPDDACLGSMAGAYSTNYIPLGGVSDFVWDLGPAIGQVEGENLQFNFPTSGAHPIQLTAISNMGCRSMATDTITIFAPPVAEFILSDSSVCVNAGYQVIDMSYVEGPSSINGWTWVFDEDTISNSQNLTSPVRQPGLWDIRLIVSTDNGCVGDTLLTDVLQINPAPIASFQLSEESLTTDAPLVQVNDMSSHDAVQYWYYFGDGAVEQFESGTHYYTGWGDYTITQWVQNVFGCFDQFQTDVHILPSVQVYIPNTFTPDGNGNNEIFVPILSGDQVITYQLSLFNRWGNLIFQSDNPQQGWNGYMPGLGEAPDGTYTWTLEFSCAGDPLLRKMNGVVFLLR
jgi:gliding motility-associated-like protein